MRLYRLGIVVASAPEAAWIQALLHAPEKFSSPAGPVWQGLLGSQPVTLLRCGAGPERAAQGAAWLHQQGSLCGLLSAGFAGGLSPALATGDAILPTHLLAWPSAPALSLCMPAPSWRQWAVEAAAQAQLVGHSGALVSTATVIQQACAKQRLGKQLAALAVDMESYSLGQAALAAGLPFFPLRTVFDTATEECFLPPEVVLTISGSLRPVALSVFLARHPRLLSRMPALRRQAQCAGQALQRWLAAFVRRLQGGPG